MNETRTDMATRPETGHDSAPDAFDAILLRHLDRAAAGRATPRELGALRDSFLRLPDVLEALTGLTGRDRSAALGQVVEDFDLLADLGEERHADGRDGHDRSGMRHRAIRREAL